MLILNKYMTDDGFFILNHVIFRLAYYFYLYNDNIIDNVIIQQLFL